ncbi:permease [Desulfovibrio litoralis]|uniref:Predicted permease n=1 Tax=Desulfovibrio litoralis DSM 11393 TaxID=1121455 RepID=A0A1M7RQG4_9BACT|nr:permease [Desulfovibrio litoralis]SHN48535.1 Predicted permease [Desulfovibrio litoralis DSM 11393]
MKTIISILNRYKFAIILLVVSIAVGFIKPQTGERIFAITKENTLEMLAIVPPIFILLGLLDVWVPKETMVKYMGQGSGIRGSLLAFILGSAAAGPLYAAFPVAGILKDKGSTLFNIFIFIGAWSTTKLPLLLFESASLGINFTLLRLLLNIVGIVVIAFLLKNEKLEHIG